MVLMDAKDLTDHQLSRVVDELVRLSGELGLRRGTLEVPPAGQLRAELRQVRVAAVGAVLPPPDPATGRAAEVVPAAWCDVAAGWLRRSGLMPLRVEVVGVVAEIGPESLARYLRSGAAEGLRVSAGSPATGIRTVVGQAPVNTRLALLAAGLAWSPADLAREAGEMREVIRACAGAAYAYLTPVAADRRSPVSGFGSGAPLDVPDWPESRPGDADGTLGDLADVAALDAFWYQVLGPGHLARTGPLPGARPLDGGRVELTLGEFADWIDEERALTGPRPHGTTREPSALRRRGRTLLAPCFLSGTQARALRRERRPDA